MDLNIAVQFHGHVCPRLFSGYRAALLAANHLEIGVKMESWLQLWKTGHGEKKALRISLKVDVLPRDEKHAALFAKVRAGTAGPVEAKGFQASHEAKSQKIEMFPIGYVENDYLEPVYDEEIYRKVSKIVLKGELAEGLYRIDDSGKVYILHYFSRAKGYELIHRTPVLDIKPYIKEIEHNDEENRPDRDI